MGLEDILHAMEEEVEGETAAIVAEAEATAGRVVTEAEARSQQVVERHRQDIVPMLSAEEARIMNEARLEALLNIAEKARESGTPITFVLDTQTEPLGVLYTGPQELKGIEKGAGESGKPAADQK